MEGPRRALAARSEEPGDAVADDRIELGRSLRTDRYRYGEYFKSTDFPKPDTEAIAVELYDLKSDPYEQHNLADSPEHRALVEKFNAQLRRQP